MLHCAALPSPFSPWAAAAPIRFRDRKKRTPSAKRQAGRKQLGRPEGGADRPLRCDNESPPEWLRGIDRVSEQARAGQG
jgi:hypothetical protein